MADIPPKSERTHGPRAPSGRSDIEARKRARRVQVRRRRAVALLVIALVVLGIGAIMVDQSGGAGAHGNVLAGARHGRAAAASRDPAVFATAITVAVNRVLTYTPYISAGRPRKREVALTFDDGPGPYTLRILAVLRRHHAPATFFEIGRLVDESPSMTRRLADAGEVIGDHTQSHPFLAALRPVAAARRGSRSGARDHPRRRTVSASVPPPVRIIRSRHARDAPRPEVADGAVDGGHERLRRVPA